jgi:hypothetical protein
MRSRPANLPAAHRPVLSTLAPAIAIAVIALAPVGALAEQTTPPAAYGYPIASTPEAAFWWCEATNKVKPDYVPPAPDAAHASPAGAPKRLRGLWAAAAQRERIALQLVVRPTADTGPLQVSADDLSGPNGARIPRADILIRSVCYVNVRQATDGAGATGEWPDPLAPIGSQWTPRPGRNNPLWITVTVPAGSPAGDYHGAISLLGRLKRRFPLTLHVWDFALPEKTALRTYLGIGPGDIRRYQNLRTDEQMAKVWDLYMRDFAVHRISPSDPTALGPIGISPSDTSPNDVKLDWTAFDREAKRYLDGHDFNAFRIDFPGLGGGRYPHFDGGSFLGHAGDTPEYDALMASYGRQVEQHLAEHGWLDRAIVYWYDEPNPEDYPIVNKGMHRLHRFAPRLKRIITEGFAPQLFGNVDLWCPITPKFNLTSSMGRQKLGEEVWWYICTGPQAPWAGEFIDHPAIELRMWLWQTWKYRVQGILIWDTTWWTNDSVYPRALQDPWDDAQSYSGPKSTDVWGNGDGRFIYPPNYAPGRDRSKPCLDGPVDSLRLELLSEGVQDWLYFHLLDGLVRDAQRRGHGSAALERAKTLLDIPESICRNMGHYTRDPQDLYRYRVELAHAIESLLHAGRGARVPRSSRRASAGG